MSETTEKQATGFEMAYHVDEQGDSWGARVWQERKIVFRADGCESKQHAEQIARDICVRYGTVKRPTI